MKTKTIRPQIQWVISFLVVDLIFWILVLGSCVLSPVDCLESATFAPYAFYLPWSLISQPWLPNFASDWMSVLSPIPFLVLIHAGLGVLAAMLWKKPVKWWMSISFALIFLIGTSFLLSTLQYQKEMARETRTQLWAIYDIGQNYVKGAQAEMTSCQEEDEFCPGGFRLEIEEGVTEWWMENSSDAPVTLIQCSGSQGCESNYETDFEDYLRIREACKDDFVSCPVYGIGGEFDFFRVTFNPRGILEMEQVYLP